MSAWILSFDIIVTVLMAIGVVVIATRESGWQTLIVFILNSYILSRMWGLI